MSDPKTIKDGMAPWWRYGMALTVKERTPEQRAWDSAILAASEYLRRRMDSDETLALELHDLVSTRLPATQQTRQTEEL